MTRLFFEPFRLATMTSLAMLAACAPGADVAQTRNAPQAAAFTSDRITVEVRGSGPDVILIPGLTSSRRIWARAVEATPGYRYHLVQLNGFGGGTVRGNAQGLVAAPATEEIARYIAETGLDKPAVVGHSMGGAIALMLAARHPEAVSRAMVVDMLPFMGVLFGRPGATPESVRETADKLRDQIQSANGVAWALGAQQNMGSMVKTEAMRSLAVDDAHRSDRGMAARALHELITTDLRPELKNITVPVRVLYVRSPATPLNEAQTDAVYRAGYANLPGASLTRVPDSYHFIMFDQPERFAAELKAFLE